ncbi:MAG TPA: GatB/YqeY domain-containing protein [Lutibacter sp.]|nr:GatB/YqeY domain-containing protein [Lutibacter sp.]
MSLKNEVMEQIKSAMRSKDKLALESLRAVKSELLLLETSGKGDISEEDELKILQKLVKQRKDSATTFTEQGRTDLAEPELAQAKIIAQFLPKQMSEDEVKEIVAKVVAQVGAKSMVDMGKVMGMVSKELAGKSDGKTISGIVRSFLIDN